MSKNLQLVTALLMALSASALASPPAPGAAPDVAGASPAKELTSDMVYAVMVAEIASQRGDQRTAFRHYLHAARLASDPGLAQLGARAALSVHDLDGARRAAALWIELAPESLKAEQIAAYVEIDAGDSASALAHLRRVVALSANPGVGYLQAAQLVTGLDAPASRLALMRELVAKDASNADAQYALATLAAAADDFAAAKGYAEQAAALRPLWNKPRLFITRMLVSQGKHDEARAALKAYLEQGANDQELRLLNVQFLIEDEAFDEALAALDSILEQTPEQPDVLFAAAVLAVQMQKLDAARAYLLRLREGGKHGSDTAFLLGQIEQLAENPSAALDWYRKVRGQNASDAQVRIAGIYAKQGDIPRAREILHQLRDQSPEDVVALYLIEGDMLSEQGLDQLAADVYTSALEAYPDDADLLYARALHAVSMGRVDVLEQDLRRLLLSEPDNVDALNALGYTLADRTDRLVEALSFIERALQLKPDEPAILDSMGWVLYRMGEPQRAEPYLRQALDKVFDAEIAAHLGEVLWALGRQDEARAIWERAMAEQPEHEYLLRVMSRHRVSRTDSGE